MTQSSFQEHTSNQHEKMTSIKLAPFQCSECFTSKQLTKVFSRRKLLNGHIRQCHGEPRFKCQVCLKPFTKICNFKQHMHVYSPENNKHKCNICQATFVAPFCLNRHLFQVHKQKVKGVKYLKCEFCLQEFLTRNNLECHVIEEHVVDKEFACPTCSKTFIDQQHLDQHIMRRHVVELKHFCQVCSHGFPFQSKLSQHLKVKHSLYYCSKCFTSLSNKLEFDQHLDTTTALQFKCEVCNEFMNSQCYLNIYTNSHLKETKLGQVFEISKPKFKHQIGCRKVKLILPHPKSTKLKTKELAKINCDLCLKSFDCVANLKSHRNKVHPQALWTCNFEQCSKTFKFYGQLKEHRVIHSHYKSYKCAICPLYFTLPWNVKPHVAYHHAGPRPFKCPAKNCSASFFNYSNLLRHSVCHQTRSNNLFKCHLCTELKTFTTCTNLKRHLRLHSNIRTNGNSLTSQVCEDAVLVCTSNKCYFQTRSEKEVALHYNQQHGLPTVIVTLSK